MTKNRLGFLGILVGVALLTAACASLQGPQGPEGPRGPEGPQGLPPEASDLSCTDCHNDTSLITGKRTAWSTSVHGSGNAYLRGTSASCAGCHSGAAFSERVAAGLNPDQLEEGDPNPTRQDCRACHQIHTSYTKDDFALESTVAVELFALNGTFDGGDGNLCANCHQPRRAFPEAVDGLIEITSTHWGPHHGAESAMLLGLGGAGDVASTVSPHLEEVENTCVSCHMGENLVHTFEPQVDNCVECHQGAESLDINGVQTEVQALLDELEEILVARGLLDEEGHPVVDSLPEVEAAALWNWIFIAHEDNSLGVHNPEYILALLEASLESLR